jgi:predicted peroxiredoxin
MSISFLLQATRILHKGNYDDNEVHMIYDYLKSIDNETLYEYYCTCSVLSYDNDLELFIEILGTAIKVLEEKEKYEKCQALQFKKLECEGIKKQKTF